MASSAVQGGQQGLRRPTAISQQRRRALPIYRYRKQIIDTMYKSQVVILQGGTGSGKTSQLVQYILEETQTLALQGQQVPGLIGCTQPRVIATMASAGRVAQELGCRVGEEVGYHVRFDHCSSDRTRILFMTDGILVQELLADPLLMKYQFIILDEAHVRSVNLDFLLPMLRRTLEQREAFSLLISSATIDADSFAEYFGAPGPISDALSIKAPIILVGGQNYTVEINYDTSIYAAVERLENENLNIRMRSEHAWAAALKVQEIVERCESGDILIFLPGQEEIEECCFELRKIAAALHAALEVLPLFGALPSKEQHEVLKPTQAGRRKVVVATNIAETSLTIDGIIHVIDSGVAKEPRFDPESGFHWIVETKISKYSAIQRAGRAGRTAPGKCYRLYSQQSYDEMPTSDSAEITRADLAQTVLQMSKLNIADMQNFPFMQKRSMPYFARAVEDLVAIGAMDGDEMTITPHGEKMMRLALEPCLANALILSAEHHCTDEMLIIVAVISADYAKRFHVKAFLKRRELRSDAGDHLTLLNVYNKWTTDGECGREWCDDNFVYYQTMKNAKKLVDQLGGQLTQLGVPRRSCGSDYERVQAALAESFADKAACYNDGGSYVWLADNSEEEFDKKVKVVPSMDSDLHERPRKLVICYKVVVSGEHKRRQMQLVTEVKKDALPGSVRAKLPEKKVWTAGDGLKKAWQEWRNAPRSQATRVYREFSLAK